MLELIAMTTMLVDHMGVVFFPDITAFRIIGRISFPIYCFLLTRGYCYTSNFNKYLLRLILLAFISQPIYMGLFGLERPNVIFTLVVCLIILKLMEKPKVLNIIVSLTLTIFLTFGFEYGSYAVLLVLIYKNVKNPYNILIAHLILNIAYFFHYSWIQQFSILGSLVITLYTSWGFLSDFKVNRLTYRAFYPIHMLCLLVAKLFSNL